MRPSLKDAAARGPRLPAAPAGLAPTAEGPRRELREGSLWAKQTAAAPAAWCSDPAVRRVLRGGPGWL